MQDTVNQAHGAVPRALADIVGVIGVSSWPTACRTISSIWVALPRRWKRTHRRAGAASPGRSSRRLRLPAG